MKDEYKPYKLEEIDFGSAKIRILKTQDGAYGLHGQIGWDDLPYWEYWDAWIVTAQAYGDIDFGPFKKRRDAKKEHSGSLKINLLEAKIYDNLTEAENDALDISILLEQKGFKIEIESGEEKEEHRNLSKRYSHNPSLEGVLSRQFKPELRNLYLKENESGVRKND